MTSIPRRCSCCRSERTGGNAGLHALVRTAAGTQPTAAREDVIGGPASQLLRIAAVAGAAPVPQHWSDEQKFC